MKEHYRELFRYNEWANKRIFVSLFDVIDQEPFILSLFTHVVLVEKLWLYRIEARPLNLSLWDPIPLPELARHLGEATSLWQEFLDRLSEQDLHKVVPYVNTKGVAYSNRVHEIATHTVNHSTHHRGQISLLIRKLGHTPPVLDLIAFARHE